MLEEIKNKVRNNLNREVKVVVNGMRNHKEVFSGVLSKALPNVFVVTSRGLNKTFSYADVLIGDVVVSYK